ncbi:MAG: caspase family protein, partial [Bacteroidia bacterium]
SAYFNAKGSQIVTASGDRIARIWDAQSGELLHTLEGHTNSVNSAVYNATGSQIVTASWDGTARIWDAQSGELLHTLEGHTKWVNSAYFNAKGSQIVTASGDNTARIWDAQSGELLHTLEGHTKWVNSAEFNTTGTQIVTASKDGTARIWDTQSGELLHTLEGHTSGVRSAVYNATGNQIVTASGDNTARIWDASTGDLLHILQSHTGSLSSVQFSLSGNHIITTGQDHKTIIWDAHTGKQLYTRLQLKGGDWLAYDEHYRFEGSPGGIDQLYLVCGLEVIDLNQVKDSLYVPGLVTQIMSGAKEVMMNDRPAPKLEDLQICELTPVVEPIDQDKTNRIRYRIIPRKGGLGNVELYINNNLTYTYKPSDLKKEPNTKNYILEVNTDTLQQYLIGDKGTKNPITIKPLIKGGGIYGRAGEGFTAVKTVDRKSPKFIGVFVGVNDYNNPAKDKEDPSYYTDLSYAEADAESMAQAMEQSARTLFDDSVLIYRVTQQSNKAPTKQELEKVFDDISKKAKSEDVLYIFFAGHGGVPKTQTNPNNEVRFMLQKAQKQNPMTTSFGLSDIRQWTNAQRMKAQKRVFVFDACHSGKIIQEIQNNMGGNLYASRGTQDQGWRKKQLDKLKDQSGMMILAASADDQSSYEDDQLKHGVMTYHLLEQMKQMPQDTTLIIKDWFESSSQGVESFIDRKYTRSTDDPYKPVQSPEMFGSGKFAVGLVNNQVKESIKLAKVKLTIGKIYFTFRSKPGEKETVHQWIYEYLQQNIDPKKMEIAVDETAAYVYTIDGSISWGDEYVSYDIIKQGKVIKKEIKLEGFNSKNPKQIAEAIAESIVKEINNIK